jgi:putative DNA primase/helicase
MRWQADVGGRLQAMDPDVPKCLNDRAADNWRPLLAIADIAGGKWPEIARKAAVELSASDHAEDSSGITLLGDIRELFTGEGDRISSSEMVRLLSKLDDRPWAEWRHGKSITTVQLARVLRPFGIRSRNVRISGVTVKGYLQADFHDAFERYLSSTDYGSATPLQATKNLNNPLAIVATTSSHVAGPVATNGGGDAGVAGVAATACAQVADPNDKNAVKSEACSAVAGTHLLGDPLDAEATEPDGLADYANRL